MSYVKKYDPGRIWHDLPRANYFYELPLFSFGDTRGKSVLSIVFNYGLSKENNSFCGFKPGYKINLQKQLLIESGEVCALQEATGKKVWVETSYMDFLDDDSQRHFTRGSDYYTLNYPDGSKDIFNLNGKITSHDDKYGNCCIKYKYFEGTDKLKSITCFGYSVTFEYDSNDYITSAAYDGKTVNFTYTAAGMNVSLFTGEVVVLTISDSDLTAKVGDVGTTAYKKGTGIEVIDEKTTKISDFIYEETSETTVDYETYTFPSDIRSYYNPLDYSTAHNQVEVIDFMGVCTRIQYVDGKARYLYEVRDSDVSFTSWGSDLYRFTGDVKLLQSRTNDNRVNVVGVQSLLDGERMLPNPSHPNVWYNIRNSQSASGCYVLSGWAKVTEAFSNPSSAVLVVSDAVFDAVPDDTPNRYELAFNLSPAGQWVYFSAAIDVLWENNIYVYSPNYSSEIEFRDLRLTYQETNATFSDDEGDIHLFINEDGLIHRTQGIDEFIPLRKCEFKYNGLPLTGYLPVYFDDLVRNKINYKRGWYTSMFFCGNHHDVVNMSDNTEVTVSGGELSNRPFSEFYPARRQYVKNHGFITTRIVDDDENYFLISEVFDKNGVVISSQIYNYYLDLISSTQDGVTTEYTRENSQNTYGRVTAERVFSGSDTLYDCRVNYKPSGNSANTALAKTDEFSKTTLYYFNPQWNTVKSATLPDGTVISNEYDGTDVLIQRTVGGEDGRSTNLEYSDGYLSGMNTGGLSYGFTYSRDELSSVTKQGVTIEEQTRVNIERRKYYYPTSAGPVYQRTVVRDKYQRPYSIVGEVYDTYDINPTYNSSTESYTAMDINNGDAKLSASEDLISGNKIKYAYDKGRLVRSGVFNSSGTKLDEECYTYDEARRLITDTFAYSLDVPDTSITVQSNIEYATSQDSASVDGRVASYSYNVSGIQQVATANVYDSFKRLSEKTVSVGSVEYKKKITYSKTRLFRVIYYKDDIQISNLSYGYDYAGRITGESDDVTFSSNYSYVYDSFGQLIRENNKLLDKTFVYSYNEIGNITDVKEYAYTRANISGTPTATHTYSYSDTAKDLLVSFNGVNISYNALGYPTSYGMNTLAWNKDRLSMFRNGNIISGLNTHTFAYNAYGQRIRKVYQFTEGRQTQLDCITYRTVNYTYDHNGRLIGEKHTEEYKSSPSIYRELIYLYDESCIVGFLFKKNGTESIYYYDRNIFGDVVGIYNGQGARIVKYSYDAWGNCTISEATDSEIATINPIRYRGYYYDKETNLYYLNSRYYSPEWRRFISPDDTSYLDPETPNGLNLYCYCGNNPVMGYDPYGTFDLWEFLRGVGNIVTGTLAIGAGVIVLIGGAGVGMLIVSGITVAAGVLSLNNGIADTVGSFTGYNYMSDGLFNGNTTAYNWYSGITSIMASIGTAICGNFIKKEYFMRGAISGTEGKSILQPGMELDRYGLKYGRFLTNPGTTPGQLNLPASNNLVLNHYKVLKPFKVATGIVEGGGGFQYFTWRSVHRLIQMGYLAII